MSLLSKLLVFIVLIWILALVTWQLIGEKSHLENNYHLKSNLRNINDISAVKESFIQTFILTLKPTLMPTLKPTLIPTLIPTSLKTVESIEHSTHSIMPQPHQSYIDNPMLAVTKARQVLDQPHSQTHSI